MIDFTKLASFLDSFEKDHPSYDAVEFIKEKIAQDLFDSGTVNNGEEDNLQDTEVTMATPEQQSQENREGELMGGAFKELDVLNKLEKDKEKVNIPGQKDQNNNTALDEATDMAYDIGENSHKQATLFDVLRKRIKK
jgi:hypothetical protein